MKDVRGLKKVIFTDKYYF